MSEPKLDDVNLVIIDHRRHLRNSLRTALNDASVQYDNIVVNSDVDTVRRSVQDSLGPDILICDADAQGGDPFRLIKAIRHNELGQNPFFAILALSWDPTQALVKRAANCGADYLVAAPFSPKQILDRIRVLVHSRAPFVVTSDYVGPDRRDDTIRTSDATMIDVPNSLRDKALGIYNERAFREKVDDAIGAVNLQKIERHARRLAADAEAAATEFARRPSTLDAYCLQRLQLSASNLRARAQRVSWRSIDELCEALLNVVHTLRRGSAGGIGKDIRLMRHLAMAIRAAVGRDEHTTPTAYDIAEAVSSR